MVGEGGESHSSDRVEVDGDVCSGSQRWVIGKYKVQVEGRITMYPWSSKYVQVFPHTPS